VSQELHWAEANATRGKNLQKIEKSPHPGLNLILERGGSKLQTLTVQTDGELLAAFAKSRDERAFEELVRRHAPMVFRSCCRLLGRDDAEDVAQAVFLVLAKKAGALTAHRCVGPWLHRVACCAAINQRNSQASRGLREQQVAQTGAQAPMHEHVERMDELRSLLDRELDALPEKYRQAIVLFHLQEQSLSDTAAALGCPEATAGTWLARGRELLRRRLAQRGRVVALSALLAFLSAEAGAADLPANFASKIAAAAAAGKILAISEGVLKTMWYAKFKLAAAVLTVVMGTGIGVVTVRTWGADSAPATQPVAPLTNKGVGISRAEEPAAPLFDADLAKNAEVIVRGVCTPIEFAGRGKGGWPQFTLAIKAVYKPREVTVQVNEKQALAPSGTITVVALDVPRQEATFYLNADPNYPKGYYLLVDNDLAKGVSHAGPLGKAESMMGVINIKAGQVEFTAKDGRVFTLPGAAERDFSKMDGQPVALNGKVETSNGKKVLKDVKILKTFPANEPQMDGDGGK
jgi:RNA polymerase sigma factor (sigma-70 family)